MFQALIPKNSQKRTIIWMIVLLTNLLSPLSIAQPCLGLLYFRICIDKQFAIAIMEQKLLFIPIALSLLSHVFLSVCKANNI